MKSLFEDLAELGGILLWSIAASVVVVPVTAVLFHLLMSAAGIILAFLIFLGWLIALAMVFYSPSISRRDERIPGLRSPVASSVSGSE